MSYTPEPMPTFLSEPSKIGTEISVTGKWVPTDPGGRFRKSPDAEDMLAEWEDIHAERSRRRRGLVDRDQPCRWRRRRIGASRVR